MLCKNAASMIYWNIDGSRDLSGSWTGFTRIILLEEEPPDGYMWSGGKIDEKTAYIQARSFMARTLEVNGKARQAEGEAKVGLMERIWMLCKRKRIDDYWNIDRSRDLSDPWTGVTQFTLLEEKAPDGYMWSGERLTGKQLTSRPDHLWPELWIKMGRNPKLKERHKIVR